MDIFSLFSVALATVILYFFYDLQKTSNKRRNLLKKITIYHDKERSKRERIQPIANYEQITRLNFRQLQQNLHNGTLTCLEVLKAYQYAALLNTEATNSVTEFIEEAERTAEQLDLSNNHRLPLHGIPFSVKECLTIKGTESTEGHSQFLGVYNNHETAPIVKFLQLYGAIPFVKTNVPQALVSFDSRNGIHGITKHPMDQTRSPGGSTSGEGALVGGKSSILGVGTDSGGSLRIPVSFCVFFSR